MKTRDAIKIKVVLTNGQSSLLNQLIGSMRFARNKLIELTDEYYNNTSAFIGKLKPGILKDHLPYLKSKYEFLKDVPSLSLQNMAIDVEDGYRDHITYLRNPIGRKIGKPHFKSRIDHCSITIPINTGSDIKFDCKTNTLTFTKFKINGKQSFINVKFHRLPFNCKPEEVQSYIKQITITKINYTRNEFYISFSFGRSETSSEPIHPVMLADYKLEITDTSKLNIDYIREELTKEFSSKALGLDPGITNYLVGSDPNMDTIFKPKLWKNIDKALKRAQRAFSRKQKQKFANNSKTITHTVFTNLHLSEEEKAKQKQNEEQKALKKAERKAKKELETQSGVKLLKPVIEKKSKSKAIRFESKNPVKRKTKGANQVKEVIDIIDDLYTKNAAAAQDYTPKQEFKNIEKAKAKVAKLYKKVSNQNKDFINKLVHYLVAQRPEQIYCIEDLNIAGMMQNPRLAKVIGRATWGLLFETLTRKAKEFGKIVIKCGRFDPSSKTCNHCGNVNKELKLSDRIWECPGCKKILYRDYNAALNIKDFAINVYVKTLIQNELLRILNDKSSNAIKDKQVGWELTEPFEKQPSAVSQNTSLSYELINNSGEKNPDPFQGNLYDLEAAKSSASR